MQRIIIFSAAFRLGLLLLLSLVATAVVAQPFGWSKAATASTQRAAAKLLMGARALSLSIHIDGIEVMAMGAGVARPPSKLGPALAATADTPYPIASVSKQFTAAVILSLIEAGAITAANAPLALDTPLQDLFEKVPHWQSAGLRVRHLLTMSSRLPSYTSPPTPFPPGVRPDAPVNAFALLNVVRAYQPSKYAPVYSNTNYFLLAMLTQGLVVPSVGKTTTFESYLQSRILDPAGMTSSGVLGPAVPAHLAFPHTPSALTFHLPDWPKGAGSIFSTVRDLQRWNSSLFGGQILSAASLQSMLKGVQPMTGPVLPNTSYGMGWMIRPVGHYREYYHSGSLAGYSAMNMVVESTASLGRISIAILAAGDLSLEGLARQVVQQAIALGTN